MDRFLKSKWFVILISIAIIAVLVDGLSNQVKYSGVIPDTSAKADHWIAPSLFIEPPTKGEDRQQLIYGQDLIANTARYLGPNGSVAHISNGMNCQNCHLDAGTRPFGNNYGAVASTYPKFRARSGNMESIVKRVNDCFERSLNGTALDSTSKEMLAIVAYIKWVGKDIPKGEKPKGSGIADLPFLERAASPLYGKTVYSQKCQTCHGVNGEGVMDINNVSYTFPPLWGDKSFNNGAGLYRISRLAGYVKDNMPFGESTNHTHPQLSDEEAWDVAAYINSQPRPKKDLSDDWPDIAGKPIDHPFGPYADQFNEQQHKYGPFAEILKENKQKSKK